ncbi:T9SS type A sorting domain-containing protein [Flavobacterium sp. 25HG05S-40]|uniref:T9SS type A sorting domain-containing protein n=1 Tax=Flavobacterium sp. 25HG05S-40 TaxID=3458682 RepID=UPI0040451319
MKKFYALTLLVFTLFTNGQIINFPDPNFKAKLLQPDVAFDNYYMSINLDANSNGEIEVSEVQNVIFLNVSNSSISDLTGISFFLNLWSLDCSYNSLTSISIDNSITLMSLFASHNQLTSINVNFGNFDPDFDPRLDLSFNNFTTFSISDVIFNDGFIISNNQLTTLNIHNCVFSSLYVDSNRLTNINFSGNNTIYANASFINNQFTVLDLAGAGISYECHVFLGNNIEDRVQNLFWGDIYYSSINTFFDLGDYRATTSCDPVDGGNVYIESCPNLQNINFKNGYDHMFITCDEGGDIFQNPSINLRISDCPNLTQICTDELEQPTFQVQLDWQGLQNQVQVNTNCTSLGIDSEAIIAEEPFTIAPVPTYSILQIQAREGFSINSLEIFNSLGQIVQKEVGNQQNIDVSRLSSGIYYLKIKSSESSYTKRFIKE